MADKKYEEIFCGNVKRLRKKNYYSRKIMAEKLGISTHALTMIESGKIPKRLSIDILFAIEEIFNISCADIFKEDAVRD